MKKSKRCDIQPENLNVILRAVNGVNSDPESPCEAVYIHRGNTREGRETQ
jgi:hypothetical protein